MPRPSSEKQMAFLTTCRGNQDKTASAGIAPFAECGQLRTPEVCFRTSLLSDGIGESAGAHIFMA